MKSWILAGAAAVFAIATPRDNLKVVSISDVVTRANAGEITKLEIQGNEVKRRSNPCNGGNHMQPAQRQRKPIPDNRQFSHKIPPRQALGKYA